MQIDYPVPAWRPDEEFWWLTEPSLATNLYCVLSHENLPPDEESERCFVFAPDGVSESESAEAVRVEYVYEWWRRFAGINVHISRSLWHDADMKSGIVPPYLIDIDASLDIGYMERCSESLRFTKRTIDFLLRDCGVVQESVRVFFSGCKGFHVVVRRNGIDESRLALVPKRFVEAPDDRLRLSIVAAVRDSSTPKNISNWVSSTGACIDKSHELVRLAGSLNVWQENGRPKAARKILVPLDELNELGPGDIIHRASVKMLGPSV